VTDADVDLLAVSIDHYLWFVDKALDGMAIVVRELGDELANRRPDLDGANSPYAILSHCLGVMEFWGGATVAERPVSRDRAAEFVAHGQVEDLLVRTAKARRALESDLSGFDTMGVPVEVKPGDQDYPYNATKGSVLVHIIEELFQHWGQMEITRDLLVAGR
jgi:hypothetical protein